MPAPSSSTPSNARTARARKRRSRGGHATRAGAATHHRGPSRRPGVLLGSDCGARPTLGASYSSAPVSSTLAGATGVAVSPVPVKPRRRWSRQGRCPITTAGGHARRCCRWRLHRAVAR
jgi:hypothetical protein